MSDWYYSIDETNRHQAGEDEIARLAGSGVLKPTSLVWKDGMADWLPAGKVNPVWFEVKSAAASGEPPPSAPALDQPPAPPAADQPPPPPAADQPPPAPADQPPPVPIAAVPPSHGAPVQPVRLDPFAGGQQTTEPLAIVSLVCGILALFPGLCCCVAGIPLSLAAIICGHVTLPKLQKYEAHLKGREMAIAGLALGYLYLLWIVGSFVFQLITGGLAAAMDGIQQSMRR